MIVYSSPTSRGKLFIDLLARLRLAGEIVIFARQILR